MATSPPDDPAAGRIVDADGVRLHLWDQGEGAATVVMEAGTGEIALAWSSVLPSVAGFTRAIAYDRAGLGRSGPSPHPRTVGSIVTELRLGLEAAGVAAPIVLVGMSFGGLVARTFAHRHPDLVAGMVLVDPSHEDQFVRAPEEIRAFLGPMTEAQLGEIRRLQALAGSGEDVRPMLPVDPSVPEDVVAPYLDAMASEESLATVAAELSSLEDSRREVRETTGAVAGSLGDMPLVVIRHDRRLFPGGMGLSDEAIDSYEATWIELQSELAATSSRGRLEVAEGAGHAIHFERPEVVVSAIREVVEATRAA